jgi:NAD(P)-dependent dehydrogenase (short-subunit alcohol dehydrogenase family)
MSEEVCLITGVGPGTGAALARRFAKGYKVAMLARNEERLRKLEDEIDGASAFPCDVSNEAALRATFEKVQAELGAPSIVLHNAVGGAFGDFMTIEPSVLEQNFQINTMALLHLSRLAAPAMIEAGRGVILCTGNTATYRGKALFAGFAPTKAAQRILAESMARSLGPQGVHVAYLAIDAVIDVPWTRRAYPDKPDAYFCQPDDIAGECWHIAHQSPSAWTFDVMIRPAGETW